MTDKNILNIKNLTKKFNDNIALDNINIDIDKGEIVALIGPSGSGKSTLMNLITGTVKADNGKLLIDNSEISKFTNKEFAKKV